MIILIVIGAILFFSLTIWLGITMPARKGQAGENKVARILQKLPPEKYKIVNDILIKNSHGTTQIDHVVLSEYGVFVIETKNYSGWIYGGEYSEEWTKNVYGNKYQFRNPLKQNYAHVKALMDILEIKSQDLLIPIIAFSNQATIRIHSSKNVINFNQLRSCILKYQNPIITNDKLSVWESKLQACTGYSKEDKKTHVYRVQAKADFTKATIDMWICPKCSGKLVLRNGKYGKFLGCSNYPRCKFTYNL